MPDTKREQQNKPVNTNTSTNVTFLKEDLLRMIAAIDNWPLDVEHWNKKFEQMTEQQLVHFYEMCTNQYRHVTDKRLFKTTAPVDEKDK